MGRNPVWTVTTVVAVALLLTPVLRDQDSFPLSTYPMYARTRASVVSFPTAVGIDGGGRRVRLSPPLIGDSDDPLVVAGELRDAIEAGRAGERCAAIAERVAGNGVTGEPTIVKIEVVTERRDTIATTRGVDGLIDSTLHARCEVGR